jgi:hypothetical protein
MKVFFDIITNHTADVIAYEGGQSSYHNKIDFPYRDASGTPFDDRDYVGKDAFPSLNAAASFPYKTGAALVDSDGDGKPDMLDSDGDNDGVSDAIESQDANGDGVADRVASNQDSNSDSLDNAFDTLAALLGAPGNAAASNAVLSDRDGSVPDYRDADADGDGIPTAVEQSASEKDGDDDKKPNYLDIDSDNDGLPDAQEAGANPN